jgi:hypothetical protein
MKAVGLSAVASGAIAAALVFAAPTHADPDTDFSNELHTYGIYGGKDYNAWIGRRAARPSRRGSSWARPFAITARISCQCWKPPRRDNA